MQENDEAEEKNECGVSEPRPRVRKKPTALKYSRMLKFT